MPQRYIELGCRGSPAFAVDGLNGRDVYLTTAVSQCGSHKRMRGNRGHAALHPASKNRWSSPRFIGWRASMSASSSPSINSTFKTSACCLAAPVAFDIELRQPHDVRKELGRRSARASGLIDAAMGFVKQGQGQYARCLEALGIRVRGFDDFDHVQCAEIIWVASEKRQMRLTSLNRDREIVITRART